MAGSCAALSSRVIKSAENRDATGTGHGPKYSMTVNFPKRKPENDYIPLEYVTQVKEYVSNYRQFKEIIEQICMINRELLKRREEL